MNIIQKIKDLVKKVKENKYDWNVYKKEKFNPTQKEINGTKYWTNEKNDRQINKQRF